MHQCGKPSEKVWTQLLTSRATVRFYGRGYSTAEEKEAAKQLEGVRSISLGQMNEL